jgi:hypothetical protein
MNWPAGTLSSNLGALVDWQLSQKPDTENQICVFSGDFTGYMAVHLFVVDGHGMAWQPLTPDRARRLAARLMKEASEVDAKAIKHRRRQMGGDLRLVPEPGTKDLGGPGPKREIDSDQPVVGEVVSPADMRGQARKDGDADES